MFTKTGITILCTTVIFLAQSAAEDTSAALITTSSKPSMHNFIGFAARTSGSCAIVTPEQVEPGKDFPITVVYTEMPELKNEEILSKIISMFAEIHQHHDVSQSLLESTSQSMVDELSMQSKINCITPNELTLPNQLNLDAIILCIKLTQSGVDSCASFPPYFSLPKFKCGQSFKYSPYLSTDEELKYSEWIDGSGHGEYDEPLTCSEQEHADSLLQKSFYAKFALVLDVAKFRKLHGATTSHTKDH